MRTGCARICRMYRDAVAKAFGPGSSATVRRKGAVLTEIYRVLPMKIMGADVVSGGELLQRSGGLSPEKLYLHGNHKEDWELGFGSRQKIGHIIDRQWNMSLPGLMRWLGPKHAD